MASSSNSKTIRIKSNDGKEFVISEAVALQSRMLSATIEKYGITDEPFVTTVVNSKILVKVIEYCNAAVAAEASKAKTTGEGSSTKASDNELEKWELDILDVDKGTLAGLIMAAFWLGINKLHDATYKKAAMMDGEP